MGTARKPKAHAPEALALFTLRPLAELLPYARNARQHSEEQIVQIAASILEFGFAAPVLADSLGIVAGHGRVLAARRLVEAGHELRLPGGMLLPEGCVPVVDCSGWSEAQRRAYVLVDNRIAEASSWDHELLATELKELSALAFDMSTTGFTAEELADLLGTANFEPGTADGQSALDQGRKCTCPECGHVFTPSYG